MPLEIEAKFKIEDLDRLRNELLKLGASNEGDCLERNWILDDVEGNLKQRGVLLRVRNMGGVDGVMTVKQPTQQGEFKTREETETMVDSTRELLKQLSAVGFQVVWIYEKIRQTWLWRDCVLALDQCPEIGDYLEIEGSPENIRHVCGDLGLDPSEHIDDTYLGIWIKHLKSLGEPRRDMVFDSTDSNSRRTSPQTRVLRWDNA